MTIEEKISEAKKLYGEKAYEKVYPLCVELAEAGVPEGQNILGNLYCAEKNYEKAVYWLEKAAEQGNSNAQIELGKLYATGIGVPENKPDEYLKIANWLENGSKIFDFCGKYPEYKLTKCFKNNPDAKEFSFVDGKMNIPYGIKTVGKNCFSFCAPKEITLPEGCETIEACAFYNDWALDAINLPSTVKFIGEEAFFNSGLKNINLPENIERIEKETFKGCFLSFIKIPRGVKFIGSGAFKDCENLKKIFIPDSVEIIEEDAFKGCSRLHIYLETDEKPSWAHETRKETVKEGYVSGGYDYHRAGSAGESIENYVETRTYEKTVYLGWNSDFRPVHKNTAEEEFDGMLAKSKKGKK